MAAAPPPRPPRQRSSTDGTGNNVPVSRQLDFYQAMSDFRHMFPNMEEEVIEAVLRANNGAVDETIDQLLTMNFDENDAEKATSTSDSEPTDMGSDTTDNDAVLVNQSQNSLLLGDDPPDPAPSANSTPAHSGAKKDSITSANQLLTEANQAKCDLDFVGSSSVRINPIGSSPSRRDHSAAISALSVSPVSAFLSNCTSNKTSDDGREMLLDLSDTEPQGITQDSDLSPVTSDVQPPPMPPKMNLLENRKYASSSMTHYSPKRPPLQQPWRRWNPPMLGELPEDFLRISFAKQPSPASVHVHSDFYGPQHVNKSQLAGTRLVVNNSHDTLHTTHHNYRDVAVASSSANMPCKVTCPSATHRNKPHRSQSMRTPSSHSTQIQPSFDRSSKRASFGAGSGSSAGGMTSVIRGPSDKHTGSCVSSSVVDKSRTWSPIRNRNKSRAQSHPSGVQLSHRHHTHHSLSGAATVSASNHTTTTSDHHHFHMCGKDGSMPHHTHTLHPHTRLASASTTHPSTPPCSGSMAAGASKETLHHNHTSHPPTSQPSPMLDSQVLQKRIVENARKRSAVSANTNPERVRYLEDEQLALMLQNDEFLAVLMSDTDFVQALERDRMNATAFEPSDTTVHQDGCPLGAGGGGNSGSHSIANRFGDSTALNSSGVGAEGVNDETSEFRRRLQLMGGSSKTKFATIAKKFFSRKKKKSPSRYKVPGLRSNIAPSTANLLEEEYDELDIREDNPQGIQSSDEN